MIVRNVALAKGQNENVSKRRLISQRGTVTPLPHYRSGVPGLTSFSEFFHQSTIARVASVSSSII